MESVKVGIREFRDKLATYLLESESPVAITVTVTPRATLH